MGNWGLDTFSDNLSDFSSPRVSLLKTKVIITHTGSFRHVFSGTQDRYKDPRTTSLSLVFDHDFFWDYMYHISSSLMRLSSGWIMSTGWGGQGLGRRKQRQKKPLCQPSLGTLRACMAEDQAHYMGTFFSYGRMYENLKGQAVC